MSTSIFQLSWPYPQLKQENLKLHPTFSSKTTWEDDDNLISLFQWNNFGKRILGKKDKTPEGITKKISNPKTRTLHFLRHVL